MGFFYFKAYHWIGPYIYIKSVSKNNNYIGNCLSNDDDDLKDCFNYNKRKLKAVFHFFKPSTFNIPSEDHESSPCNEPCSSINIQFFKPRQANIQCPLCNYIFTLEHIEFHASTSDEKFSIILPENKDDSALKCHFSKSQILFKQPRIK